jgi:hypothetical protein
VRRKGGHRFSRDKPNLSVTAAAARCRRFRHRYQSECGYAVKKDFPKPQHLEMTWSYLLMWWWGLITSWIWTPSLPRRVASGFLPGQFARAGRCRPWGRGTAQPGAARLATPRHLADILVGSRLGETGERPDAQECLLLSAWTGRRYRHHASSSALAGRWTKSCGFGVRSRQSWSGLKHRYR